MIKKLIGNISFDLFRVSIITYILLQSLEELIPTSASFFIDLNAVLVLVIGSGISTLVFHHSPYFFSLKKNKLFFLALECAIWVAVNVSLRDLGYGSFFFTILFIIISLLFYRIIYKPHAA